MREVSRRRLFRLSYSEYWSANWFPGKSTLTLSAIFIASLEIEQEIQKFLVSHLDMLAGVALATIRDAT